jgi:CheY-like chemotaxis protein
VAVRPLFESKGLDLDYQADATLPQVFCDPTRIREVILNLLSNAGRFTDQGGVQIRMWREDGVVVTSVADTGPGIGAQDKEKLFQPFRQLDSSASRRHGGTGIGLSLSKSFVELHGGRLDLESQPGQGSTFYVRLPVDPPPPEQRDVARWFHPEWRYEERTRPSLAPAPVVRPRLVVQEEGSALARLLTRFATGAEIARVTSLSDAVEELGREPAQALFINELSVAASLERLGSAPVLPNGTPAVICSVAGPYRAAGELGAQDYLVKPVSTEALLATLDRLQIRGGTILVVDDDPDALRLFWRMLAASGRGYQVLTAVDGKQGLRTLRRRRPDALLLDLMLPEMDGFQLLAAKNADPALRAVPTVILSAQDPAGLPTVTGSVAIVRGGGLSMPQLLACAEAICGPLSLPTRRASV